MNLVQNFQERLEQFIETACKNQVKMILVGGGAVNFHGYQRHSADVYFWIEISIQNLEKLLLTLQEMNFHVTDFPEEVKSGKQNVSIKISSVLDLELITSFNPGKSFEEAYNESVIVEKENGSYHVLSFNDLIISKISTDREKDKRDVEELHRLILRSKNP